MFDDLGDEHHEPRRRRPLGEQHTEIDPLLLDHAQRLIERAEQHPPPGGIGGRVIEPEPQPHAVVDLRRIEPEMGPRQRKPVGEETGPRHEEAGGRFVIGPGQGFIEKGKERVGGEERFLAAGDEGAGEAADRFRVGGGGAGVDLRPHRLERCRDPP